MYNCTGLEDQMFSTWKMRLQIQILESHWDSKIFIDNNFKLKINVTLPDFFTFNTNEKSLIGTMALERPIFTLFRIRSVYLKCESKVVENFSRIHLNVWCCNVYVFGLKYKALNH